MPELGEPLADSKYVDQMTPVVLLIGSLAVLGIGWVLTLATTRTNEVRIEPVLSRGRVLAAVAVLADVAGAIGACIAIYLLVTG
jgi:hypothetical protein